jgi:hypothetical protein
VATIAVEISSRSSRVAALQRRRDRLCAGLDMILDQRVRHGRFVRRRKRDTGPGLQGPESRPAGDPHRPRRGSLVAELRGHERRAAQELGRRKTVVEERSGPHRHRKVHIQDVRKPSSEMLWVCSRVREPQEAISTGTIALEIPSRNARVAALQKRWTGCAPAWSRSGPAERGHGQPARRRQRNSVSELQGQGSRSAGDAHRPRSGFASRLLLAGGLARFCLSSRSA